MRAFARATALTFVQTAVRASAPAFTAILFGGAVVFSKQGMHPRDLTSLARNSVLAAGALWGAWLLIAVPIVRAVVRAPGAGLLRSLPISRAALLAALAVGALIPQLPWALLWTRAEGLAVGVLAMSLGLACSLQIVAGVKSPRDALALLIGLVGAFAAPRVPLVAGVALVSLPHALSVAWDRAGEEAHTRARAPTRLRVRRPFVALWRVYTWTLVRTERPLLLRSLALASLGGLIVGVVARNRDAVDTLSRARILLAVGAVPFALVAAALALAVRRPERTITWLLATTATRDVDRTLAALVSAGAPGLVGALALGAAASAVLRASSGVALALTSLSVVWAAMWALVARVEESFAGDAQGSRFAVAMFVWLALAWIAVATVGAAAPVACAIGLGLRILTRRTS
jgi:hypothetical protein